jgi:hypothetical protein
MVESDVAAARRLLYADSCDTAHRVLPNWDVFTRREPLVDWQVTWYSVTSSLRECLDSVTFCTPKVRTNAPDVRDIYTGLVVDQPFETDACLTSLVVAVTNKASPPVLAGLDCACIEHGAVEVNFAWEAHHNYNIA